MKNVVLVNPPSPAGRKIIRNTDCAIESKANYLIQPYDLILLSGCFPPACPIVLVDATVDRLSAAQALERIRAARPDILILSLSEVCWDNDFAFLQEVRRQFPQAILLTFGDAFVEDHSADLAAPVSDGILVSPLLLDVETLLTLDRAALAARPPLGGLRVRGFYADAISKTPEPRTIGIPRHELFQHRGYRWPFARRRDYATVMVSWGCPYRCSYCIDSRFPFLYRPFENVLPELDRIREMGIRELYFADKSFGLPLDNTASLLAAMADRAYRFSWSTYLHPLQYEPGFLRRMRETGCHTIITGVETVQAQRLKRYGRHVEPERIREMVRHAHELKMDVCGDFILGLADETEHDIRRSVEFALELDLDFASFNIATPLPGSSLRQAALADGRMTEGTRHFDTLGKGNILPSNVLSAAQLVALRAQAIKRFYLRPRYLFKRLAGIRTLDQLRIQVGEMLHLFRKGI